MEITDIKKYPEGCDWWWITKDKFLFDNGKFRFYYRWFLTGFTKHTWNGYDDTTEYTASLMVDDKYIHESRRNEVTKEQRQPFLFKRVEKRGEFDINILIKTLNSALKLKIEPKIKVNNYKKLKEILNGYSKAIEKPQEECKIIPSYMYPSDYDNVDEQCQLRGSFLSFVDENKDKIWFDDLLDKAKKLERNEYFKYCNEQDIACEDGYVIYEYLRGPFKKFGIKRK